MRGWASSVPADKTATGLARAVNPARVADWDARLAAHPDAGFFHSAAWAAVLADTYGFKPAYFADHDGGKLHALLPLMEVDSWLTGRRGVGLPFTDDCEPLAADYKSFRNLVHSALAFGRERRWKSIEFRGGRRPLGDVPASLAFYGHEVDLTAGADAVFGRADGSVRRAIRKAEKNGMTLEVADSVEAVRVFYKLLCGTRKKHGMPPQPFEFFRNIHARVLSKKLGVVILARFEGRPVAGAVYFGLNGRALYKFGASDEAFQALRGNNLVMWEAIKWHAGRGFKTLNLGRTSLANEGLRRFKLGWGATESRLEYVKYDLRNDRFLTDTDQASGWHNRVFRLLPVSVSRLVGAALYRHWA